MGIFDFLFKSDDEKDLIKDRDKVEDFFKIDIHELFRYDPIHARTEISTSGNQVNVYMLKLKAIELNQFGEIEIIEVAENEFNLIFKGISNYITKDMEDLIALYTKNKGYDKFGNGVVTQLDRDKAKTKSFLRWWDNLFIGNMPYDTMVLKLYGVKMNSVN